MSYNYEAEKEYVFTDRGSRDLIQLRDRARALCEKAGCVRAGVLMAGVSGDSFKAMALIDRIVEIGDLIEVHQTNKTVWQNRIFTWRES